MLRNFNLSFCGPWSIFDVSSRKMSIIIIIIIIIIIKYWLIRSEKGWLIDFNAISTCLGLFYA